VLFHSSGQTTRFNRFQNDVWREVLSGQLHETRASLAERLRELDAAMFRSENDHDMNAQLLMGRRQSIDLGMDELLTRSLTAAVDADGSRRWDLGNGNELLQSKDRALLLKGRSGDRGNAQSRDDWAKLRAILVQLVGAEYDFKPVSLFETPLRGREFDRNEAARWLSDLDRNLSGTFGNQSGQAN
jgi:hypothetical protein